jgi:hypothetical protein
MNQGSQDPRNGPELIRRQHDPNDHVALVNTGCHCGFPWQSIAIRPQFRVLYSLTSRKRPTHSTREARRAANPRISEASLRRLDSP